MPNSQQLVRLCQCQHIMPMTNLAPDGYELATLIILSHQLTMFKCPITNSWSAGVSVSIIMSCDQAVRNLQLTPVVPDSVVD
jgi:hypothetical protein